MKRIVLTDNSGRWFNAESAEVFHEDTDFDGCNEISIATGSEWTHQALWRTAGGRWILNTWGSMRLETYVEITSEAAARWLVINGHEPHKACSDEFAKLEIQ